MTRKEHARAQVAGFWVFIMLLVASGISLIVLAANLADSTAFHSVILAAGEATLIAGLLAATVDRYMKTRLAQEMAEEGALAALDISLPPQFKEHLQDDVFGPIDRVYGEVYWKLNFSWCTECGRESCLAIAMRHEVKGARNVKNDEVYLRPVWIPSSAAGHHTKVSFFKFDRDTPGGDIQLDQPREVEAYAEVIRGDVVIPHILEGDESRGKNNMWRLVKGEVYEIEMHAEVYRHEHDYLPLVVQAPVLSAEIRLDGSALQDLSVAVDFGSAELPNSFDDDEIKIVYEGLLMPEQTFIVTWARAVLNASEGPVRLESSETSNAKSNMSAM